MALNWKNIWEVVQDELINPASPSPFAAKRIVDAIQNDLEHEYKDGWIEGYNKGYKQGYRMGKKK